jgi:hypothetical protein
LRDHRYPVGMNRLDPNDPGHVKARSVLRTVGPIVFCVGLLCAIISAVNLFTASGEPTLFWLGFVGLPLMFVGAVMSMTGWVGALARYHAREGAPVAGETFNYMAGETRDGIRDVAAAVGEGLRGERQIACAKCGTQNDEDSKFCKACGAAIQDAAP